MRMCARSSVVRRMGAVAMVRGGASRSRPLLVALLVLSLAACAVGPDFFSPTAPVADNFSGTNGRSLKTNRQDYRDWWLAFSNPTLNRLVQIAYNQNLTLLSAAAHRYFKPAPYSALRSANSTLRSSRALVT